MSCYLIAFREILVLVVIRVGETTYPGVFKLHHVITLAY